MWHYICILLVTLTIRYFTCCQIWLKLQYISPDFVPEEWIQWWSFSVIFNYYILVVPLVTIYVSMDHCLSLYSGLMLIMVWYKVSMVTDVHIFYECLSLWHWYNDWLHVTESVTDKQGSVWRRKVVIGHWLDQEVTLATGFEGPVAMVSQEHRDQVWRKWTCIVVKEQICEVIIITCPSYYQPKLLICHTEHAVGKCQMKIIVYIWTVLLPMMIS